MERITRKQLENAVLWLNKLTDSPEECYRKEGDKWVANVGNYHISGAYGGFALHRMGKKRYHMIKLQAPNDHNHTTQRFARTLEEAFPNHLDYTIYEPHDLYAIDEDDSLILAIGFVFAIVFITWVIF